MTFTTRGRAIRFIEHTPKRWAEFVRTRYPIVESIVPIDKRGSRKWAAMSDRCMVAFAQKLVYEKMIGGRDKLKGEDNGLYEVLRIRKLLDKVEFKADERAWRYYSADELVAYARKFIEERKIVSRSGLQKADGSFYEVLRSRELVDRLEFKADERSWTKYSDDELVAYAQRFVDESKIEGRSGLHMASSGLYAALTKKNLLDRVKFKNDERAWSRYSDDGLIAYAQRFVDESKIEGSGGLRRVDGGLYESLRMRKLIGRVFSSLEQNQEINGLSEISDAMSEFGGEE